MFSAGHNAINNGVQTITGINNFPPGKHISPFACIMHCSIDNTSSVSSAPPLIIPDAKDETIRLLRIDGNTVNNAGVGDLITDSESSYIGKYAVPFILSGINLVNEPESVEITSASSNKSYKCSYTIGVINHSQFTAVCSITRYSDDTAKSSRINIELCYSDNTSSQFNGFYDSIPIGTTRVFVCASVDTGKTLQSVTVRWADYGSVTNRHCRIENMMLLTGIYTASTLPDFEAYFSPKSYTVYLEQPLNLNESVEIKNSGILLHNGTNILTPMSEVPPTSLSVKYTTRH